MDIHEKIYLPESYKVVYEGGSGEIIEKKSRFIASVFPAETEDVALALIERTKKTYWDATHNCHAFTIGLRHEICRCSDDGGPAGTAGRPMLDVLLGEPLFNTAVVVTRYFGGTLLGTGGLVRAYSKAVAAGLAASKVIEKRLVHRLNIVTDYTGLGKIQYICAAMSLAVLDCTYTQNVTMTVLAGKADMHALIKKVSEATSGQAVTQDMGLCYSAVIDKRPVVFDI